MSGQFSDRLAAAERPAGYWLFSAPVDLAAFLGSALLSLGLLAWGARHGLLHDETPDWTWVALVLMIDVAHVWATGFRVYFDRAELARRPQLYFGVPILALLAGIMLYQLGEATFWRVLAYVAVFHFVRQQSGWVALYRAKLREPRDWQRWLDAAAIYLATLYPLVYWHAHLPRHYWWFLEGDFLALPPLASSLLAPVYWTVLGLYAARSAWHWLRGQPNPGKDLVVGTTALCWYLGIVTFNSDYAFTVTNVVIHGVPYLVLIIWYVRSRQEAGSLAPRGIAQTVGMVLGAVWLLAYAEELVWDRAVWQERGWLFGSPLDAEHLQGVLVPLLAVPQLTHYVLDGFIWRRGRNPSLQRLLR
ncbi:MAG: hypothetical protein J5I93_19840 [Pirellulaceae bacterium]|nr:hypothetical protein [Pirellulaceae bacterium]